MVMYEPAGLTIFETLQTFITNGVCFHDLACLLSRMMSLLHRELHNLRVRTTRIIQRKNIFSSEK